MVGRCRNRKRHWQSFWLSVSFFVFRGDFTPSQVDLQRFELWSKRVTTRLSTCLFCRRFSWSVKEADVPTLPYLPKCSFKTGRLPWTISVLLHLFALDHRERVLERCPARHTLRRLALIYCASIKRQERSYFRQLSFCNPCWGLCYLSLHAYRTIILAVKTNPGPIFFAFAKVRKIKRLTSVLLFFFIFHPKSFGSFKKGCIFAKWFEGEVKREEDRMVR